MTSTSNRTGSFLEDPLDVGIKWDTGIVRYLIVKMTLAVVVTAYFDERPGLAPLCLGSLAERELGIEHPVCA